MPVTIEEKHPELFHYTSSHGLSGILRTQTLWATHYAYLNDALEVTHFLDDRLPNILRIAIKEVAQDFVAQSEANKSLVDQEGSIDEAIERTVQALTVSMRDRLLNGDNGEEPLAEPHIASFCVPKDDNVKKHGLLSQWRGYGRDGGYAIIFNTAKLSELMKEFGQKCKDGGELFGGDVAYSDDPIERFLDMEEFGEYANAIRSGILKFFQSGGKSDSFREVYPALTQYACRYKHWGFKEEIEVRMVAMPNNKEVNEFAKKEGITVNEMPRGHFIRSGTLVPFIELLKGVTSIQGKRLPINRIIVGPHPERKNRVRAVEILLNQCGIDAKISESEIPYIER